MLANNHNVGCSFINISIKKIYSTISFCIVGGETGSPGGEATQGGGGESAEPQGPGEEELGRFWELLDPDTQPIMPIPGCPESQQIFEDHKEVRSFPEIIVYLRSMQS